MALYSVETNLSPEDAVAEAKSYFGEGNLGLELVEDSPCCIHLVGGGGHVRVTAGAEGESTTVELETREWDYHVRKFMQRVAA